MFAGLISKEKSVSAWGDPDKIMVALAPYSLDKPRNVWASDKQMLVQVATRTGSTSAEIYQHTESGIAVAFWGRLDNRPDLIAQLEAGHKSSDDELIALAWLKWGEHCPEKLIGDFSFAVASPKTGIFFLARDVMGVKPLYYRCDEHGIFFANTAAAFKPLKLGTLTRSEKWMAEYMLGLSYSHTETAYEEIKKLQGAHCLLIQADGRMNLRRYHQFVDDAPIEKKRDPKYLEAYRAAWQEAVACRLPATGNIGTENSGGLDSGSITAEVARRLENGVNRLSCFGFCLEEQEPKLIMSTAMKFRIPSVHLSATDYERLPINFIKNNLLNGYPIEHQTATDHSQFYELCQNKEIGTLFSGFGGDEVVTNEGGGILFELLDTADYHNLYKMMRGSLPLKVFRTAKLIIKGYRQPRINPKEIQVYQQRWQYSIISEQVSERYGIKHAFLAQADWGSELRRINSEVSFRLSRPYIQTRLANCTLMAASHGIDYVWPMLDRRLIQQWLSTPSIWKAGNARVGRYLHRMAVDGICPPDVAWKAEKDMGFSATYKLFDEKSNLDNFRLLAALSEKVSPPLSMIVDQGKISRLVTEGLRTDSRGYELCTALNQSVKQLDTILHWLQATN